MYRVARQFRATDPRILKWSMERIFDWKVAPVIDCPVYHIHGDCDRVLPMRYTHPDTVVKGGGHLITLTHASCVNDFLQKVIHRSVTVRKEKEVA